LLERVEQVTGKRLNVASLFNAPTIEALAQLLRRQTNLTSPSPLIAIQPHGALTPCFFVHPAGGSVLPYIALSRALGSERPFYALEGTLGERQIESIAARYIDAVRAVRPDGPYLLGGWSTGGVVVFEMARQLQANGAQVAVVALLDSVAPGAGTVVQGAALITGFFLNIGVPIDLLEPPPEQILHAGTKEQLDWVLDQAQSAQLLPPDMSIMHLRHLFDLYQSDINAVETYRPAASPVSLLLLCAADEGDGELENLETGWSRLSTKNLEVHTVPGDHLTMMRPPHVSTLAEILRKQFAIYEQMNRHTL
jgi:thioesterase domain-containing protein